MREHPVKTSQEPSQSKPVQIRLGDPPSPIAEEVSEQQLESHVACMADFTFEQKQHLTAAFNLSTPPCEPCFNLMSYAECFVTEQECEIAHMQLRKICDEAGKGEKYSEILSLLRFQDLWFDITGSHSNQNTIVIVTNHNKTILEYLQSHILKFQDTSFKILLFDDVSKELFNLSATTSTFNFTSLMNHDVDGWQIASEPWMASVKKNISELEHRSYPTIYIGGYRMSGMQSSENIAYLMERAGDLEHQ